MNEDEFRRKNLSKLYNMNDKVMGLMFMMIFTAPLLLVAFVTMGTKHDLALTIPLLIGGLVVLIAISVCVAKFCLRPRMLNELDKTNRGSGDAGVNVETPEITGVCVQPEKEKLLKQLNDDHSTDITETLNHSPNRISEVLITVENLNNDVLEDLDVTMETEYGSSNKTDLIRSKFHHDVQQSVDIQCTGIPNEQDISVIKVK
uniref:Uncharacterized protein LOC102802325 n=1 Tax=Saccoglossus kowalevskii TaxID=10224 RepID=A0ABM0MTW9_SACKO|nr:PREDICTED: uncharacterized protein LOC102802325 [Saccoglossus kowalevskii]